MRSAFHRLQLHEDSRNYTAFLYNGSGEFCGVYRYRSLNQGGSQSPKLFCNAVSDALRHVFKDMDLKIHIDDGLLSSTTMEQHEIDVAKFLHAAFKIDLALDIAKCKFAVSCVDWCSLRFENGTVRPSPDRLTCLQGLTWPDIRKNKPGHKAYLRCRGLLNYFRKYCPRFSQYMAENADYVLNAWDADSKLSFSEAQEKCNKNVSIVTGEICKNALVVVPEGENLNIFTDASSISYSFVLTRASDRRPVIFGGKSFNKVQRSYGSLDRELLAVRLAIDSAAAFISTAKLVTIHSDNLTSVLQFAGAHNEITARSLRLLLEIKARCGPQVKFQFIEGVKNVVADALSRLAFHEDNIPSQPEGDDRRKVQFSRVDRKINPTKQISENKNGNYVVLSTRAQALLKRRLRLLHNETHCGWNKLLGTARELKLTGSGLRDLCIEVCDECESCYNEKRLLADNFLGNSETQSAPMRELSIDHVHLIESSSGNAYALTVMDTWSKFFVAIPVPALTMDHVLIALQCYLSIFSTVSTLRADQAFKNSSINELCDIFGINLKFYASHNSRSSNVERCHSTYREKIEAFLEAKGLAETEWDQVSHLACKAVNSAIHLTTKHIPYELVFNIKPEISRLPRTLDDTVVKRRAEVTKNIVKAKEKYSSKSSKIPRLEPGTVVTIRYGTRNKSKPFKAVVTEDPGGLTLTVKRLEILHGCNTRYATIRVSKRHVWVSRKVYDRVCHVQLF